MSNYIPLLLLMSLVGALCSGHGRPAQHNSNPELPIRSIQLRSERTGEALSKSVGSDKPEKEEIIYPNSYIIKRNITARRYRIKEKRGFLFDNYDNLSGYERASIRMSFELDRLTQKLYKRLMNYYKGEWNDERENFREEITDYATLGALLSIGLLLYTIFLHVYYIR